MSLRTGTTLRFGRPPYHTVLVHGGPGAPGSLGPPARELSTSFGVVEPWQSARTIEGQVEELAAQVERWADPPVVVVGHSWGAWLALLFAAQYPTKVRRLILLGAPPLRARYASEIRRRREERLSSEQWALFQELERCLSSPRTKVSPSTLRRLGELAAISDSYALLPGSEGRAHLDPGTFRTIWSQAEALRRKGTLSRALRRVRAPVLVLHGDVDPHPIRGIVVPLRSAGLRLRVVLLKRCGHEPWREQFARARFFEVLRAELART